ncbi:MAG: hypothetical protein ACRD5L_10955, partial [Bryobacteraceae bacterium]
LWVGSDPVAVSQIVARLRGAGIRHFAKSGHEHLAFGLAMPRPRYEILTYRRDAAIARYFVIPVRESLPFALDEPPADEEPKPNEAARQAAQKARDARARKWTSAQAVIEVWAGDDAALGEVLEQCLRENDLPFRSEKAGARLQRILARPEEAERCREIVREVVEGVPPG